jgi:aconitate hydratase
LEKSLEINGETYTYFDLSHFEQLSKLPYSIRVLLESALRNCDNFHVKESDVTTILNWAEYKGDGSGDTKDYEIPFKPSRVILQDFTGVPAGERSSFS